MSQLRDIQGEIYDFDGVFYSRFDIQGMDKLCVHLLAQAALSIPQLEKAGLTYDEAAFLGEDGYKKYRDSFTIFRQWFQSQGATVEESDALKAPLYRAYHHNVQKEFIQTYPHLFTQREDLKTAFKVSAGLIKHGIASHSCRENILVPLLSLMGIRDVFQHNAICGLEQSNFELKHNSPALVELGFKEIGVDPSQGVFVEDTPENLAVMKDRHPDMIAILLHHGRPLDIQPSYVDFQFRDIPAYKKAHQRALDDGPTRVITLS